MKRSFTIAGLLLGTAVFALCSAPVWAESKVTALRQGMSPTVEYTGVQDGGISPDRWEKRRSFGSSAAVPVVRGRRMLIHFDLAPIAKEDVIHRAVLRLFDTGYPKASKDGKFPGHLKACRLASAWKSSATWTHAYRTKKKEEGRWKTPGGDLDVESDFGQAEQGLIATSRTIYKTQGYVHELDLTSVVQQWHSGKLENHGLALMQTDKKTGGSIACSEWSVKAYRPLLLVDHGPKDSKPASIPDIPADVVNAELDAVSATKDVGAEGEAGTVYVGLNAKCAIGAKSMDAYIRQSSRYAGNWGWMTANRVGGCAGNTSRSLMWFDLSELPKNASIKSARLHLTLVPWETQYASSYRYGAYLVKLPDSPGWDAGTVTATERKSGKAWPDGGAEAATAKQPVAIGKVVVGEVTYRKRKRKVPVALDFDLTGAVRAWVKGNVPNCGIMIDNRLESGRFDFYSSRCFEADKRPYLELSVTPAIEKKPQETATKEWRPDGDYWVEPMKLVHRRFKGKAGTMAMYGDSITITGAYLSSYGWSKKIEPKNCTPEVKAECDVVAGHADLSLWRKWKGGGYGNDGSKKSDWFLSGISGWQKRMNPEAAVILFGTNDLGSLRPPNYTENMAVCIRRMMQDGTVPMLTTVPPKAGRETWATIHTQELYGLARAMKIPVIDYYAEIMRRRPDDWNGKMEKFKAYKGYNVPTLIARDGTHPSNFGKLVNDWSEEGLNKNGYTLRNYMTVRMYYQVITKVLKAGGTTAEATEK